VLSVNYIPLNGHHPTGLTMGSLFKDWPKDRLAQVWLGDVEPDLAFCPNSRYLGIADMDLPEWVGRKAVKEGRGRGKGRGRTQASTSTSTSTSTFASAFSALALNLLAFASYRIEPELIRWIEAFKPDLIYSVLGTPQIMRLVRGLSSQMSVPIVPHVMDDWMSDNYRRYLWDPLIRRRMLKDLRSIIEEAPVRLAIGDAFSEELRRRYGRQFLPFMNCVDTNGSQQSAVSSQQSADRGLRSFRFVFTGGLHMGRWEVVREIGQALADNRTGGRSCELVLFGPEPSGEISRELKSMTSIRYAGLISPSDVMDELVASDCLVIAESFAPGTLKGFRFSMSTKLPEYLSAGRPILAYGPGEQASIRYIRENGCGLVVDHHDVELLRESIRTLAADAGLRAGLGARAQQVAREHHEGSVVRAKFKDALSSLTKNDER
jgi:glycosyltransferase involved in cell wall biosynthesis